MPVTRRALARQTTLSDEVIEGVVTSQPRRSNTVLAAQLDVDSQSTVSDTTRLTRRQLSRTTQVGKKRREHEATVENKGASSALETSVAGTAVPESCETPPYYVVKRRDSSRRDQLGDSAKPGFSKGEFERLSTAEETTSDAEGRASPSRLPGDAGSKAHAYSRAPLVKKDRKDAVKKAPSKCLSWKFRLWLGGGLLFFLPLAIVVTAYFLSSSSSRVLDALFFFFPPSSRESDGGNNTNSVIHHFGSSSCLHPDAFSKSRSICGDNFDAQSFEGSENPGCVAAARELLFDAHPFIPGIPLRKQLAMPYLAPFVRKYFTAGLRELLNETTPSDCHPELPADHRSRVASRCSALPSGSGVFRVAGGHRLPLEFKVESVPEKTNPPGGGSSGELASGISFSNGAPFINSNLPTRRSVCTHCARHRAVSPRFTRSDGCCRGRKIRRESVVDEFFREARLVLPHLRAGVGLSHLKRGDILLRIPRLMVMSSKDAHPRFKNCEIQLNHVANGSASPPLHGTFDSKDSQVRKCMSHEVLALELLLETRLKVELARMKRGNRTGDDPPCAKQPDASRVPALSPSQMRRSSPTCFLKTNKHNAPYFDDDQWRAVSRVLPQTKRQFNSLLSKLQWLAETSFRDIFVIEEDGQAVWPSYEDYRHVLSILYARNMWDVDDNSAVTPVDHLFSFHWDSDKAVLHEAHESEFLWSASRDINVGEKIYTNHGQYNNFRLLYHYGEVLPENYWGPVFFFRRHLGDLPAVGAPFGAYGVSQIKTREKALYALPAWMLFPLEIPADLPCHYGFPSIPCPVSPSWGSQPSEENREGTREAGGVMSFEGAHSSIVCDLSVFDSPTYHHGALVSSKHAPIGTFDPVAYRCVREMKFGNVADVYDREARTLDWFSRLCKRHLTVIEDMKRGAEHFSDDVLPRDAKQHVDEKFRIAVETEREVVLECVDYFENALMIVRQIA